MTGMQLAPELPLEELFFLALLCYLTMNLVRAGARAHRRRARRAPMTYSALNLVLARPSSRVVAVIALRRRPRLVAARGA